MAITDEQKKEVAGGFIVFIGDVYDAGADLIPGPGGAILKAHAITFNGLGDAIVTGGTTDASSLAYKIVLGDVLALGYSIVGSIVLGGAATLLGITAPVSGPILFLGSLVAAVAAGTSADAIVDGYKHWYNNGGPEAVSGAISEFASKTWGAATELASAFEDVTHAFFNDLMSRLNDAASQYDGTSESLTPSLSALMSDLGMAMGSLLSGPAALAAMALEFGKWLPSWAPLFNPLSPPPTDPLVLDLNGNGNLELIPLAQSTVHMDMDGNGYAEKVGWVAPSDGLLAIDRNGNGQIDGISDLFGNAGRDGFAALRDLDSNGDGKISAADTQFSNLRVWQDLNSNGVAEAGEVKALADWGISEISLSTTPQMAEQVVGINYINATASIVKTDGTTSKIGAAYLATDRLLSKWTPPIDFTVGQSASKLPDLAGFGRVKNLDAAMTLDGSLQAAVQTLVLDADTMTGPQIKASFQVILLQWMGASEISPSSRGEYVDARHLGVIEALYDGQYVDRTLAGVLSSNPNHLNGPTLEILYKNIVNSMMTDFFTQVASSRAALTEDALSYTSSRFWPLSLLTDVESFPTTMALVRNNMPTDSDAASSYLVQLGTVMAGAVVNIFGNDANAYKQAIASSFDDDLASATIMQAALDHLSMEGTASADTISGGSSLDLMVGGAGADTLVGHYGNDLLTGGTGNDVLAGGDGDDTYVFNRGDGQDTINEYGPTPYGLGDKGGSDTLQFGAGITAADLVVTEANSGKDLVVGLAGTADKITITNGVSDAQYRVEQVKFADGSTLSYDGLLAKIATANSDVIYGDERNNVLSGLAGNDTLIGRGGNDTLDGGAGTDTVDYSGASSGVLVNIGAALQTLNSTDVAAGTARDGDSAIDTLSGLEKVVGTKYADWMYGSANADTFMGGAGSDNLNGDAGNDVLNGGAGDDMLTGGAGTDTADYTGATAKALINLSISAQTLNGVSVAAGTAQDGLGGTDTLATIEKIIGTGYADWMYGSANADTFVGAAGNDTINGGAGTDTVDYSAATVAILANLSTATQTLNGTSLVAGAVSDGLGGTDALTAVEAITGGNYNDWFFGSAGADTFSGGNGDDLLVGGAGNDKLTGGAGTDTINYTASTAGVLVNLSTASQTLNGTSVVTSTARDGVGGTDTLATVENVTGSAFADYIYGSTAANGFDGGAGNDWLFGGTGADTFIARSGSGTDTVADYLDGTDKLRLIGTGATSFADLALADTANGTTVSYNGQTMFVLTGASKSVLDNSDFLFV